MSERITDEDLELLGDLGVDCAPTAPKGRADREKRIVAGFEEIERFVKEYGSEPQHGEARDIFERIFAARLDRIRASKECCDILKNIDSCGLLEDGTTVKETSPTDGESDDQLLESLGINAEPGGEVTKLVHVRAREEINAAEEIARRNPCKDFEQFKKIFEEVQRNLANGECQTVKYENNAQVGKGDIFILDGQKLIVADLGDRFVNSYGRPDRRLRVVYDNGTESDLLIRSLQRALNKDEASRRIIDSGPGPLFSEQEEVGDLAGGYIYVLRSMSQHPFIIQNRDVIHKIGGTSRDVASRLSNAKKDPTYLLADVEIMATFKLANINWNSLEILLHKFLAKARLDLDLKDRFGLQVTPREWFLVPLPIIAEIIEKIKDGVIDRYEYDLLTASLRMTEPPVGDSEKK